MRPSHCDNRWLTERADKVELPSDIIGANKTFESACYFFTLAYHYLSEYGREQEYYNALLEAFGHLGE